MEKTMSPKNESNIPQQLASWNGRGFAAKMKSALHAEKLATFGPGSPCIFQGGQAVVITAVSAGERIIRLVDGRQLAVNVDDLEAVAREFRGNEQAEESR